MFYRRTIVPSYYRNGFLYLKKPVPDKAFELQETGRRIWDLLEYPISIAEIAQKLTFEFSGNSKHIERDTALFVQLLVEKGLVAVQGKPPSPEDRQRFRYLYLLKRSLLNLLYPEHELRIRFLEKHNGKVEELEQKRYLRDIRYREPQLYSDLIDSKHDIGPSGQNPYRFSHTMIGLPALDNIERCSEIVFSENIPGDFMEAGVCQGGATIFMRGLQVCYGQRNRKTWVADSFQGVPKPASQPDIESGVDWSESSMPYFVCSLEMVRDNFSKYDLLDDNVQFLPGWFSESLPKSPVQKLAILRLDGDLYSSIMVALENLYPLLVKGGFLIVDDYGLFSFCRRAVDEYRANQSIKEPIQFVNQSVIWWRKQS